MSRKQMKVTQVFAVFLAVIVASNAFTVSNQSKRETRLFGEVNSRRNVLENLALLPLAVLPSQARANEVQASSSLNIAEAIKVLDMGLPSYGDIKESTASVSTVKSLTVDGPVGGIMTGGSRKGAMPSYASSKKEEPKKEEPKEFVYKRTATSTTQAAQSSSPTSIPKYDF